MNDDEEKPINTDTTDLPDGMGLPTAKLISEREVLGITISGFIPAVGLATLPAFVVSYAGNSSWLAMVAATTTFVLIALLIRVFAKRYVGTGSLFSYIRHAMGSKATIVMAAALVPGYVIAVSALLLASGLYLGSFLVSIGFEGASGTGGQLAIIVCMTALTIAIVYRGIDVSVKVSVLLTIISVPFIVIITGAVLFSGNLHVAEQLSLDGFTLNGFLQGVAIGTTFYVGFESTAALGAETREPRKVIPRAILVVPLGLGTIYTLATFIQTPALIAGSDRLAAGASPPAVLAESAGLGGLAQVTELVLATALFASLIAFTNYGSRVIVSAASQGLLPRRFREIHKKHMTPYLAMLTVLIAAATGPVLLLLFTHSTPLDLYAAASALLVYAWIAPYVLVCLGAAKILRREAKGGIGVTILAVALSLIVVWLYVNSIIYPGPAPLNLMPYVSAVILVLFVIGFGVVGRRRDLSNIDL